MMSIKHPYGEYIPLLECFAQFGPLLILGWRGNELDHDIWREMPARRRKDNDQRERNRFAAQERYRRLGLWFMSAVESGEIELYAPAAEIRQGDEADERAWRLAPANASGMRKIEAVKVPAWWAPTAFCGRLTVVSVEDQLQGAVTSDSDPEVYGDPGVVNIAVQRFLSLNGTADDDEVAWSLSQVAYWIATGRPELVRDWKGLIGSTFDLAIQGDLLTPMDEARAMIWGAVVSGKIETRAVPAGGTTEEVVSPGNLRRLKLETKHLLHDTHDLLISQIDGAIAFYDPTVSRAEVIKRWPLRGSTPPIEPDLSSILKQLESGALSVDEAEKMAGRALVQEPSKAVIDLKAERYWTIPMVLAGMISDDTGDLIEQMNDWRQLVRHYYVNGERMTAASLAKIRKERGHKVSVKRLEPAGFWLLMNGPRQDAYSEAWAILRDRLGAGTVEAHGVNQSKKQRERIEAHKWPHLVAHGSDTWDGRNSEHYTEPEKDLERYSDIRIARAAVQALRNAFKKVPATERLTHEERKKCDTVARKAFDLRVKGWPRTGPFPNEDDDFASMRAAVEQSGALPKHKAVPRKTLRAIRRDICLAHNYSEADWLKKGQRKKSAE